MREKRHALGYSQAKLAELVKTAPTYIAMIELEKKFPSVDMLERIACALNMDSPELFSMESFPEDRFRQFQTDLLAELEQATALILTKHTKQLKGTK